MKKNLLFGLLAIVMCFVLVGCGKKVDPIVGSWASADYGDSFTYTFNEDGTGKYLVAGSEMKFTYTIDGDKISILYDGNTAAFETTFTIKDKVLNIKDSFGSDTLYNKK